MHGEHADLLIEANTIREDVGAADPACWGLGITPAYATPEGFLRTVIRGNTFRNVGNIAIALGSCQDCVVENNVIVSEQTFGGIGGKIDDEERVDAVLRGEGDRARLAAHEERVVVSEQNDRRRRMAFAHPTRDAKGRIEPAALGERPLACPRDRGAVAL